MATSDLLPRPLVIDTNIVLDLLVFQDEKMQPLLADIEQGVVRWLATPPMRDELERVLDYATGQLPVTAPRYLMGVGKPDDIVGAVQRGVDMFDCVLPTRSGRNGQAFTHDGPLNIRNAKHAEDGAPLDGDCPCPACRGPAAVSRAYLHHLVKSNEMLGAMLMTEHNIGFYQHLMAALRAAISEHRLTDFADNFIKRYKK